MQRATRPTAVVALIIYATLAAERALRWQRARDTTEDMLKFLNMKDKAVPISLEDVPNALTSLNPKILEALRNMFFYT